ncbi:hypothetical protein WME75_36885 [Sorangium sp. So ce1014]|uniref:hypothetical protein n=1 Tax=Sorangium sp. So ce1014 TaxID=3133326 RepID=UPI003F60B383
MGELKKPLPARNARKTSLKEAGFMTLARGLNLFFACAAALLATTAASGAKADTLTQVVTTIDALNSTAAVVEGRVVDIAFTYDPVEGPRTVATLADVKTHLGTPIRGELKISTLGGPHPNGRRLYIPELPEFHADSTYIVFLTRTDWFYSPVVSSFAFRVENVGSRQILINQQGHAIVGASALGIELSGRPVSAVQNESTTRLERPALLAGAESRATGALSKSDFLTSLSSLAKSAAPRGEFRRSVAPGRTWNITKVAPGDPADVEPNAMPAEQIAPPEGLVCDSVAPEKFVCIDPSAE